MRYLNDPVLVAEDLSGNLESIAIDTSFLFQMSAQAVVSGASPVGTFKIQCSNDKIVDANLAANTIPVNWSDIPGATAAVNANGNWLIEKFDMSYQWIRVVWVAGSGTGTISVNIMARGQ